LIEIKTVNDRSFSSGGWGEDGTDEIPEYYLAQVQWQMYVTGADHVRLVAFVASADTMKLLASMAKSGAAVQFLVDAVLSIGLHEYVVYRSDALIADMVEAAGEFWRRHIIDREPVPDYGRMIDDGKTVQATADDEMLLASFKAARIRLGEAEEHAEKLANDVKNRIGSASAIAGAFGVVTWKKSKDGVKTDWQAISELLGAPAALVAAHTEVKPGSRRLVCPRSWVAE
jgi:predicted phage-related endonuclease